MGRGKDPMPARPAPIKLPGVTTRPSNKPGQSHKEVVLLFGRIIGFIEDVRRRPGDEGKGFKNKLNPWLASAEHGAFLTYAKSRNEALLRVYQNQD